MKKTISYCKKAAEISNDFEKCNTELKRQYLVNNIILFNKIVTEVNGYCGSFGTGYPFYTLKEDLTGELPVIREQIRYNLELIDAVIKSDRLYWNCAECIEKKGDTMPDLKMVCKPCPNMDDSLKPRKIINRLPDLDLWVVCKDDKIDTAKEELIKLFEQHDLHTSDINPVKTIDEIGEIAYYLNNNVMPNKALPIDAHIVGEETLYNLIEKVPGEISHGKTDDFATPYLPIHPLSYRKTWQYDDEAYNFVHDYLSSLTAYNFGDALRDKLIETRNIVANSHSIEELYNYLLATGPESVKRRHETHALKRSFIERVESWKK